MPQSITAAPHPLTLGGREYLMSPLTDMDFEHLSNWMRSSVIRLARASFTETTTSKEREETLLVAMREARKLSAFSEQGRELMASMDGASYLIWLGVRHNHPDVTHEEVRSGMFNADDALSAMKVWEELNLGESSQGPLAKAKRSRKKKSTQS